MRPIKFRGKSLESGEWVQGLVAVHTICGDETELKTVILQIPEKIYQYESCVVDTETIGQYTGLKDSDGVDIYEGDLIEFGHEGEKETREVKYYGYMGYPAFDLVTPENAKYYFDSNALSYISEYGEYPCYVVGNIYDDPELLDS